jgi:transketolase
MRKFFSEKIENIFTENSNKVFITGDLGFNALETVQKIANTRFINAGVAEQNMVGVAAGLAYKGFETFVYSIAPFVTFRCLEQIKIDVCIHNLPVYIIGNGGGYGYGIMGATHHAIEDIACLSALPNMVCFIPAFSEDVSFCLDKILERKKPSYLRLGLGKSYPTKIDISFINEIIRCEDPQLTIIVLGPVVHNVIEAVKENPNISLFTILTIPILEMDDNLLSSIEKSKKVLVVEEHVQRGGLAEYLLGILVKQKIKFDEYEMINAQGYPSKLYGNQAFHQEESGLDIISIKSTISKLLL